MNDCLEHPWLVVGIKLLQIILSFDILCHNCRVLTYIPYHCFERDGPFSVEHLSVEITVSIRATIS